MRTYIMPQFIKIFQRPNIHRSNIIDDSVTQTSFFL